MTVVNRYSSIQETINDYALVDNFLVQTTYGKSVAITLVNSGNSDITWIVYGGNLSDMTDAIIVKGEATVLDAGADSYSIAFAPFEFYYVYVANGTPDSPSTVELTAIVKD